MRRMKIFALFVIASSRKYGINCLENYKKSFLKSVPLAFGNRNRKSKNVYFRQADAGASLPYLKDIIVVIHIKDFDWKDRRFIN